QRIVHRDVKPANVLHAGENRWKLADFVIARLPDSDLTQIGIFMGTPGYSPPEAIRHGHYTAPADVSARGAVLYELMSGRTTNGYVLKGMAVSVRDHDASIRQPLADVTMRALSPSVDERYKDAAEAEEALRKAWEHCLNSNMIPASCLTGEEVPHERVGPEMHSGRAGRPAPAAPPPSSAPSLPPPLPQARGAGGAAGAKPVLIIESRGGQVSDDAPTRVLPRESSSPAPVAVESSSRAREP